MTKGIRIAYVWVRKSSIHFVHLDDKKLSIVYGGGVPSTVTVTDSYPAQFEQVIKEIEEGESEDSPKMPTT